MLGDAWRVSGIDWKEGEPSLNSPKQIGYPKNTLEHALTFLKGMVNEHVFMNLLPLSKKNQSSLILRSDKIMSVSEMSMWHTKWNNQCSWIIA